MQLVGRAVKHNAFGNGIVTDFSGNIITICFSQGDKKFIYPDAFAHFLTLKDKSMQNEIHTILNKRVQEANNQKQKMQEEQERVNRLRNLKITPNSQAAFNLDSTEIDAIFLSKSAFTGRYLSGHSKGEPRIPNRLKPNSACLLTECPDGTEEKNRRIVGAFMVRDDFFGARCKDGLVKSHDQFIIRLNLKNQLLFWDYFDQNDSLPRWGNTVFKYFSNTTMQQMLQDMKKAMSGSKNEPLLNEFYDYFCEANRLPKVESNH